MKIYKDTKIAKKSYSGKNFVKQIGGSREQGGGSRGQGADSGSLITDHRSPITVSTSY